MCEEYVDIHVMVIVFDTGKNLEVGVYVAASSSQFPYKDHHFRCGDSNH